MAPKVWDGYAWVELALSDWGTQTAGGAVTPDDVRVYDGSAWQSLYPAPIDGVEFVMADSVSSSTDVDSIDYRIPDELEAGTYLVLIALHAGSAPEWTFSDEDFTVFTDATYKTASIYLFVAGKTLTEDDPGSIVSLGFTSGRISLVSRAYSNVDPDDPIDGIVTWRAPTGAAYTIITSVITAHEAGSALVSAFCQPSKGGDTVQGWTIAPPMQNAMGAMSSHPSSNNADLYTADLTGVSAGTYSFEGTSEESRQPGAALFALRPA